MPANFVIKPFLEEHRAEMRKPRFKIRGFCHGWRLQEGMKAAKELLGADKIYLEAQTYAREFYEKQGLYVLQ